MAFKAVIFSIIITGITFVTDNTSSAASNYQTTYAYRWSVTELGNEQTISPPWKLLWSRSPVWFEKFNAGGKRESPNRRIFDASEGFVTVIKRTMYVLDKKNGKTLWAISLEGGEISDWTVIDNVFVYTAIDWEHKRDIRAAIDLIGKKQLWVSFMSEKERVGGIFRGEWVMQLSNNRALFSTYQGSIGFTGPLAILDPVNGSILKNAAKDVFPESSISYTWFAFRQKLYGFVGSPGYSGLNIKLYDISGEAKYQPVHIFGDSLIGNRPFPLVVSNEGKLFFVYQTLTDLRGSDGFYWNKASIVSFDLINNKKVWDVKILLGDIPGTLSIRQLLLNKDNGRYLVATIDPNKYVIVDTDSGSIVKQGEISNYVGWTELNAVLYSYPYLFTSARRQLTKGMAYDLIAINLITGKIDWSYEIDKQDSYFSTAAAEILNFIGIGDKIYLSRADGRIMCFQAQSTMKH